MGEPQLEDVEYYEIIHETEKAILFDIDGKQVWLPRSMIEVNRDDKVVTMPHSFAVEKEIV